MNKRTISGYSVRLKANLHRDGRAWIASAPALDVMTQDKTKKEALDGLRDAVEAWFESCIARQVLEQALLEAGFKKTAAGEEADEANIVSVAYEGVEKAPPAESLAAIKFKAGVYRGTGYILGDIPAYIAAAQLGDSSLASA